MKSHSASNNIRQAQMWTPIHSVTTSGKYKLAAWAVYLFEEHTHLMSPCPIYTGCSKFQETQDELEIFNKGTCVELSWLA